MAKENSKAKRVKMMCAICGCVFEDPIPIKCPACGAGKENFYKMK